ncbi:hypothetical protein DPMN_079592 [Dreissena polymorpha]|uniref:Uncharacterized protein n=1 Tax=Dreissena polymorpha TaxID=45954 RepID=A0A9D4BRC1_DREPO|nr:hypothetical protein DPMN_079592 [Dreissena polymorpha]
MSIVLPNSCYAVSQAESDSCFVVDFQRENSLSLSQMVSAISHDIIPCRRDLVANFGHCAYTDEKFFFH